MALQRAIEKVNIRPGVSILSVLKHLNYRPWFAIAEFVDNAIQSFIANRDRLAAADGQDARLTIAIELDTSAEGRMVIRDNAAGISAADYERAFKPAEVPVDRTGLSEFGMGLKSAACWLARDWNVRTTALGEEVERTIYFDVSSIIQNRVEELSIQTRDVPASTHYTEIILAGIHKMPQGRTIGKIKEHLAGIYRAFLREGFLELKWDGEPLVYEEPAVLVAPFYHTPSGNPIIWRKEIDFDFGEGLRARGFAALRERASLSSAGFALFRRNRVIQGSGDEGYRPDAIFGKANSYRYQRLFGELHLDGFEVSHTKDGFRWEEHEEIFLEFLHEHLNADPVPLLTQAEEHRARPSRGSLTSGATAAADRAARVIERDIPQVMEAQIEAGPEPNPPPAVLPPSHSVASERTIDVVLHGHPWRIMIELTTDPSIGEWVSVSEKQVQPNGNLQRRSVAVRLSLAHPFTDRFGGTDVSQIEPLLRLAAAIGLAEIAAREAGVQLAGTFRRIINELLREALSNP